MQTQPISSACSAAPTASLQPRGGRSGSTPGDVAEHLQGASERSADCASSRALHHGAGDPYTRREVPIMFTRLNMLSLAAVVGSSLSFGCGKPLPVAAPAPAASAGPVFAQAARDLMGTWQCQGAIHGPD